LASAQDERILNERRRRLDRAFDATPVYGCPLDELDRLTFEREFLPQAIASDVLAANDRSYEDRLASLGMIASADDPTPTVAGILTLGKSPRTWMPCAYIQFLRIRGTELADPIADAAELDGTLQQLLRNAVMHRTYEGTNAPVRLYWFDDRIEIHSPGGPYGVVNVANFGQPGACDYRNQVLAGVLKALGFVQRFGFGIAQARRALAADLFSLQRLRNLGPTLTTWRADWSKRVNNWSIPEFPLPAGHMTPLGYILMQHMERLSRPVKAYKKWVDRIPATYGETVTGVQSLTPARADDGNCLARLKHYRSLIPMAQETRKPVFHLTSGMAQSAAIRKPCATQGTIFGRSRPPFSNALTGAKNQPSDTCFSRVRQYLQTSSNTDRFGLFLTGNHRRLF